jgi:hypothetical protein
MAPPGRGTVAWRQRWDVQAHVLPKGSGFRHLEGVAEYVPASRKLMLTVSAMKPLANNFGPPAQHRRLIRWPAVQDLPLVRKAVAHEIAIVAKLLAEGRWPEKALHLQTCNQTGMDLSDFMESFCARCIFPSCALRE